MVDESSSEEGVVEVVSGFTDHEEDGLKVKVVADERRSIKHLFKVLNFVLQDQDQGNQTTPAHQK